MNHSDIDSLQERIFRLLDGEMNANEAAALDAELLHDKEARSIYLQLSALHSTLEHQHASRSEIGHSSIIPIDRFLARQHVKIVKFSALAAAAIVMISATILWMKLAQNPPNLAHFQITPDASYSLIHSGKNSTYKGQELRPGSRLILTSGAMEAKFSSGVRCIIEAPCDITALSEKEINLSKGIAWFHVPKNAHGFTVNTSELRVIDLGTKFGIVSNKHGVNEVHVIEGSVKATHKSSKKSVILKAGQARRSDDSAHLLEIAVDVTRFPDSLGQSLLIQNSEFDLTEKVSPDRDSRGYGTIPNWATGGYGVGLSDRNQPFLHQNPHSGSHVAFIQGKGMISQSVSGFDSSKKYTVTYFVSERGLPDASTRTAVSLDLGTSLYREPELIRKTDAFRRIVSGPLHVFGPTANIEIRARTTSGDAALLIDSVSISRAAPLVSQGGFENPIQPPSAFKQAIGAGSGSLDASTWKFFGGAGITSNNSDFAPNLSPEGSQAAVLQDEASMETIIHEFEPGVSYRLNLKATGRKHEGTANFQVLLDGKPLTFKASEILFPAANAYQSFASDSFTTNAESIPLLIKNTSSGTCFIDDIHFEFIAESQAE